MADPPPPKDKDSFIPLWRQKRLELEKKEKLLKEAEEEAKKQKLEQILGAPIPVCKVILSQLTSQTASRRKLPPVSFTTAPGGELRRSRSVSVALSRTSGAPELSEPDSPEVDVPQTKEVNYF